MAKKRKPPSIKGEFCSILASPHPTSHRGPLLWLACLHSGSAK